MAAPAAAKAEVLRKCRRSVMGFFMVRLGLGPGDGSLKSVGWEGRRRQSAGPGFSESGGHSKAAVSKLPVQIIIIMKDQKQLQLNCLHPAKLIHSPELVRIDVGRYGSLGWRGAMKNHLNLSCIFLCLLLFTVVPARAVVLIGNLTAPEGSTQDQIGVDGGPDNWVAVSFTMPPEFYSVSNAVLRIVENVALDGMPALSLWRDVAGAPGDNLMGFSVPTLQSGVQNYTFNPLGPVALGASETYWLVVGNTGAGNYGWRKSQPPTDPSGIAGFGNYIGSANAGATWNPANLAERYKFEINGVLVPEPSTAFLFLIGFVALGMRRRA